MNTQELIDQYKLKHAKQKGYGAGGSFEEIKELIDELPKGSSILDFGCGKGKLLKKLRKSGYECEGFDPAVPQVDDFPDQNFDAVICTDVLEHIRESDVSDIFNQMLAVEPAFVFLTIAHFEAFHQLPNGRNCHEPVQTPSWWWSKISQSFRDWRSVGLQPHRPGTSRWLLERPRE